MTTSKPNKHAKLRCKQRKGEILSKQKLSLFISQIQQGKGLFVKRVSKTRTIWKVKDENNTLYKVVYSRISKNILTILPDDKSYLSDFFSVFIKQAPKINNTQYPESL